MTLRIKLIKSESRKAKAGVTLQHSTRIPPRTLLPETNRDSITMNSISKTLLTFSSLAVTASLLTAQGANSIPTVIVTLENHQPSRGTLFTPPWIGIHDGSFDTYDGGSAANLPLGGNEIESLAEDGNSGPLTATFDNLLPLAPQLAGVPGPFGPIAPGDRVSVALNVNPTLDCYLSYASMAIPSNDTFIANGNPMAHMLFDSMGKFVGQNFIVSGDETNDAGTELNDEVAGNVAFLAQSAPNTGVTESGVVTSPSADFAAPGSLSYPDGIANYPVFGNADYNDNDDRLLSFRFRFGDLGGNVSFRARLTPQQEVQSDLIDSSARGTVQAVSMNAQQLRVRASFSKLSGPVTAARLHVGQAGTNGAVVVDLSPGLLGHGHLDMLVTAADLSGQFAGQSLLSLLNDICAENVYINLVTAAFPAGEVRGQLQLTR
jgi:hypothetical protein